MKKLLAISFALFFAGTLSAHMMTGNSLPVKEDDHTKQEEAEGKEIWEKLQAKTLSCEKLSDDNFAALGEYFMGRMMGDAHSAMNEMITRAHGEDQEKQIHEVMGRRFSGCDPAAAFPAGGQGWMPMMWGGWNNGPVNGAYHWGSGFLFSLMGMGILLMLLWWAVIVGIVIFILRWLLRRFGWKGGQSALDILNERYARGELSKQEYDERKKSIRG